MEEGEYQMCDVNSEKIGRNEMVDIEKDGKTKTLKFKKAEPLLTDGWKIVKK
jgi:hypothetical protein